MFIQLPAECSCESVGTNCTSCMADARCVWKNSHCKEAPPSLTEVARNKIILSEINCWKNATLSF